MQLIPLSPGKHRPYWRLTLMALVLMASIPSGCADPDWQKQHGDLFTVHPGEERDDFARMVTWIASHDGHISLTEGSVIRWQETDYYRWYSNGTHVVLCCPPRFSETKSELRWLAGSVSSSLVFSDAMRGVYRVGGTYEFPGLDMRPTPASNDGIFGVRFGDDRARLRKLMAEQESDETENNRIASRRYNAGLTNAFDLQHLKGEPGTHVMLNLKDDAVVSYIAVRMPQSPGLAGTDFMDFEPPIRRSGFFVVDKDLVAKGRKQ